MAEDKKTRGVFVDKDYQDLFLKSPLGPKVLGKMIDDVDFLNIAPNEELQIAQNEVKAILSRCGIGVGLSGYQFVTALKAKKLITNVQWEQDNNGGEE